MIWFTFSILPLLVAFMFLAFGGKRVTLKEFIVQCGFMVIYSGLCATLTTCANTADVEILNGRVTSKAREIVNCSHSYKCRCYETCSGSGSTRSCTEHCSTCYDHSYDVDWAVYSSLNTRTKIDRIDRQGLGEPPRFTSTVIGEPFSETNSYKNYIKDAPDTLFRHQGLVEKYLKELPEYPGRIFDYWKINRTVSTMPGVDIRSWNAAISEMNADLGAKKQVNIVPVFLKPMPSDFGLALEQWWLGGKKNDVVVVISGTPEQFDWVYVIAWTDNQLFKIKLRDDLMAIGKMDSAKVLSAIQENVTGLYQRKSMKDFQYLEATIKPTPMQWVVGLIIGFMISFGLGVYMYQNDVFGEEYQVSRRRYR